MTKSTSLSRKPISKTRICIPNTKVHQINDGKPLSLRIKIPKQKLNEMHNVRTGFMNKRQTEYLHNLDIGLLSGIQNNNNTKQNVQCGENN